MFLPQYTRILGMKRSSSSILKCMKNSSSIPVLTKMADAFKVIDVSTLSEDQKKAQERAVYLATQQIIEHLQKSLDKYGDNDYK